MLEKLRIKNFQCHGRLELDLAHPVVCLVGSSDVGKSAVLRALRWLITNKPAGAAFVKHGADHVRVELEVDGHRVKREKVGGDNGYWVDGHKYQAFGADVPEPVDKLLDVGEASFQRQHDAPWWFSLTPGRVAKELNAIVDLEVIDRTLANIAADLRKAKAEAGVCMDRLIAARHRRMELRWAEELDADLKRVEAAEKAHKRIADERTAVANLVREGTVAARKAADAAQAILDSLWAVQAVERLAGIRERSKALAALIAQIAQLNKRVEACRTEAKEAVAGLKRFKKCPACGALLPCSHPTGT